MSEVYEPNLQLAVKDAPDAKPHLDYHDLLAQSGIDVCPRQDANHSVNRGFHNGRKVISSHHRVCQQAGSLSGQRRYLDHHTARMVGTR